MADIIRRTDTHVTIAVRFSQQDFQALTAAYPKEAYALRAVRLLIQDAVHLATVQDARDAGHASSVPRSPRPE
jgi:hypothetical protein